MDPIQSFAPRTIAEIIRRQPASKGKTRFAWQLVVGPALARVTTVELDAGILRVQCDERWARELTRAQHVILPRLQQLLGTQTLERIAITGTSR
jgi:predicted nucleic acid-binding Zn ribbon protein